MKKIGITERRLLLEPILRENKIKIVGSRNHKGVNGIVVKRSAKERSL
jgi:hypothetical protein